MLSYLNCKYPIEIFDFGYNVFESMRVYRGRIFCLDEHIKRLEESAKSIQIKLAYSREELKRKILEEIKKKKIRDAYVRLSINGKGKLEIILRPPRIYPEEFYKKGVKVITVPTIKESISSTFPQTKTGNFLNGIFAFLEKNDSFEAILLNRDGFITEGTVSNIFMVKDEILFTSPLYLGILPGITRRLVLKIAESINILVKEAPFTRHELYNAQEVFLTNTSIEIMPVISVDNRIIGQGYPGKTTQLIYEAFRKLTLKT